MRVGAMFYYRTNREQFGERNRLQPTSAYTPFTVTVPNGPGGTVANPQPATVTVYNVNPALVSLRTTSATTRTTSTPSTRASSSPPPSASRKVADAGRASRSARTRAASHPGAGTTNDLNDPNFTLFPTGHHRQRLGGGFRLSGSYALPVGHQHRRSMIPTTAIPYVSTFLVTRALAAAAGRDADSRQPDDVRSAERGDERFGNVTMVDLRLSQDVPLRQPQHRAANRLLQHRQCRRPPWQHDGGGRATLSVPSEILSPRIIRVGFSLDF